MYICTSCGNIGEPTKKVKGSLLVEVGLWLFFLLPGLIYSLWRLSNKVWVCPHCGKETMIPADSPIGLSLQSKFKGKNKSVSSTKNLTSANVDDHSTDLSPKTLIALLVGAFLIFVLLVSIANNNVTHYTTSSNSPSPTPDLTLLKKDLSVTFCKKRQGEYISGYYICLGCVDLDDMNKRLNGNWDTVIHNAKKPPTEAACTKAAEICLRRWDEKICKVIAEKKVGIGMTKEQLMFSMGIAKDENDTVGSWGIHSQWVYGDFGPYVYLEGRDEYDLKVTSWQD